MNQFNTHGMRRTVIGALGAVVLLSVLLLTRTVPANAEPGAQTTPTTAPTSTVVKLYDLVN